MALGIKAFFGGFLEKIADKGGDIIKELVKDKDLAAKLDHEFRTLLSTQTHDFKKLELETETRMFEAQQKTIQAELHQNDLYTKRTRPKIARQSWGLSIFYAVWSTVDGVVLALMDVSHETSTAMNIDFQWEVYVAIAAPALAYMGVRAFDKWKNPNG